VSLGTNENTTKVVRRKAITSAPTEPVRKAGECIEAEWMFYAQPYGCDIYVRRSMGKGPLIAQVHVPEGVDFDAIAYLLRAAPDLLEACRTALIYPGGLIPQQALDMIAAAVAKAGK
jgi:hypothetical protein